MFFAKPVASVAMLLSIVSWGLLIAALIVSGVETPVESGVSTSFALWVYSVIAVLLALIPYCIDGILCIAQAKEKDHPLFNSILAILLFGAVPMAVFVGGGLGMNILIWNLYHLAFFVMELVSLKMEKG